MYVHEYFTLLCGKQQHCKIPIDKELVNMNQTIGLTNLLRTLNYLRFILDIDNPLT